MVGLVARRRVRNQHRQSATRICWHSIVSCVAVFQLAKNRLPTMRSSNPYHWDANVKLHEMRGGFRGRQRRTRCLVFRSHFLIDKKTSSRHLRPHNFLMPNPNPNSSPADDDWRLQGQEAHLLRAELERTDFVPPSPQSDHDHCEFCWAKFMDSDAPNVHRTGYKTVSDSYWVCDECFADFQARFHWTVKR